MHEQQHAVDQAEHGPRPRPSRRQLLRVAAVGMSLLAGGGLLAEGPFDPALDQMAAEVDPDRRLSLTVALGNRLVQEHRGVRIGLKSALWAVSKKVGAWPTLASTQFATNLDLITPA